MSRALNYYVIAEGVETELELRQVIRSGCDGAQGYHICHPSPPQELLQWQSGETEKLRA